MMNEVLRRSSLGMVLIAVASAALLATDRPARRTGGPTPETVFKIAVVQHVSQSIIADGVRGLEEGLAEKGFVEGKSLEIRRYNAEGDLGTANSIAQEVVDAGFDLVVTLTTPSLQTVANANRDGKARHVFMLVTDPTKSGVGVGEAPLDHPPHLVGLGTMQPIPEAFETLRRLNPTATRVGMVWNAGEVNSEIGTKIGRAACKRLGIELIEANA
ncbi:MAG: ABC transporter substrate binding protein, partial [Planctomycetia bacterium]